MTDNEARTIKKDTVVTLDYSLEVNGQEIDKGPIQFIQGYGNIIPGLESQVEGMEIGEEKEVLVMAKEAYGDYDPDLEFDVPRSSFPSDFNIELGRPMQMHDGEGHVFTGVAIAITDEKVRLNLNHPLAGKDLLFKTSVKNLRQATDDEIAQGRLSSGCSCCSSGDCSDC